MGDEGAQPRPTRESMREVKREAKVRARQREEWARSVGARPRRKRSAPAQYAAMAVGTLVVLSLAYLALGPLQLGPSRLGSIGHNGATPPLYPSPTATATAAAATTAASTKPATPFDGTPVADWSEGAAGVVAPAPRRVGHYSKAQVRDALRQATAFVLSSSLDPQVVFHGKTQPLMSKVDRSSRHWFSKASTPSGFLHPMLWLATRFDPASTRPDGPVVKVNGSMKLSLHGTSLVVRTEYAFVYPVRQVGAPGKRLVLLRHSSGLEFQPDPVHHDRVSLPFLADFDYLNNGGRCGDPEELVYDTVHYDEGVGSGGANRDYNPLQLGTKPPEGECYTDTSGL